MFLNSLEEKETLKILILICNKHFHMTKFIRTRYVQTVCNIKPKPWSQISGPGT